MPKGYTRKNLDDDNLDIPQNNKCKILSDPVYLDHNTNMDQTTSENPTDIISDTSKSKVNAFYIELNKKWINLAKNIKDVKKKEKKKKHFYTKRRECGCSMKN